MTSSDFLDLGNTKPLSASLCLADSSLECPRCFDINIDKEIWENTNIDQRILENINIDIMKKIISISKRIS